MVVLLDSLMIARLYGSDVRDEQLRKMIIPLNVKRMLWLANHVVFSYHCILNQIYYTKFMNLDRFLYRQK